MDALGPGLSGEFRYTVSPERTVPHLLPEASEFLDMPAVLATGYLIAIVEWACIRLIQPYLAQGQITLGTKVDLSHEAPTPPGDTLVVSSTVKDVDGRNIVLSVEVHDGRGIVSRGEHTRAIVDRGRFEQHLASLSA